MNDVKGLHIELSYSELIKVEPLLDGFRAKLCKMYYELLIDNIKSNKFGFENSKGTLRSKKMGVPLIQSGKYLNSITFDENKVFVKEGRYKNGLTFTEISDILEYGRRDKHIPAFPVWQKTLEEFKPIIVEEFKKLVKSAK